MKFVLDMHKYALDMIEKSIRLFSQISDEESGFDNWACELWHKLTPFNTPTKFVEKNIIIPKEEANIKKCSVILFYIIISYLLFFKHDRIHQFSTLSHSFKHLVGI